MGQSGSSVFDNHTAETQVRRVWQQPTCSPERCNYHTHQRPLPLSLSLLLRKVRRPFVLKAVTKFSKTIYQQIKSQASLSNSTRCPKTCYIIQKVFRWENTEMTELCIKSRHKGPVWILSFRKESPEQLKDTVRQELTYLLAPTPCSLPFHTAGMCNSPS